MRKQWITRAASVGLSMTMALTPAAQLFAAEEMSTETVTQEVVTDDAELESESEAVENTAE